MAGSHLFNVRFHLGGRNWPTNPYGLQGPGSIAVEPDFVTIAGLNHSSFRLPKRAEHRVRMVDIVNVRTEGPDLRFDVLGVKGNMTIGGTLPDAESAQRLAAMLPARQTEAFAQAHAEFEAFHDRIDYWSPSTPVIWGLLTLNVGIYFIMWLARRGLRGVSFNSMLGWGWSSPVDAMLRSYQLMHWGSNHVSETLNGQWWRLVTSMFLHGSLLHIAFNMLALWQVGQLVERIFGSMRFLGLYMIAGVCGSLGSLFWNVLEHHDANSVGASGAIFGIIGGLLAFIRRENSGVPPTIVKELRASTLPFLLFNLTAGFLYPHTDNAAHLGGLVGGFLAGHLLARSLHVPKQAA
jgi:membrane associated rhomboid family serine protease